ncbi:MAG TPA: serine/threonine-protein kinase, partial [Terriglobia bacterium]|nr:serine/threonine-protein kinase [Terriglobia bacterium]
MIGKTISHYQVLEKLGEGGMGVVYKARDTHLDRFVALKILPAEKVADSDRRRRFVQEAKAASALNHPHIVTIYDIDEADGVHFIAMEYVDGKTLDQLIPRHGMRLNEALKVAVQMSDALAAAHEAGIVHRDLKPGNLMVTEKGQVKVLDFGLAKLTEKLPTGAEDATLTAKPDTEEGKILGTVAYMSPEQAEGKKVDARSDIFSLGSVFYEMMTGEKAFQGSSKISTLSAILHQEPKPISTIGRAIPADLEKLIRRCLRKDPERRIQHMVDVKLALLELKEESDSGTLEAAGAPGAAVRGKLWWAGVLT